VGRATASAAGFHGIEREGAQAVAALVILRAEGHLAVLQGDEAVVGDGHAMSITGQVLQDMLGVGHGLFRVDHPLLVTPRGEALLPRLGLGECPTAPWQGQLPLTIEVLQPCQVQSSQAPREDTDRQEEVRPTRHPARAIRKEPPAGRTQCRWG